MKDNYQNKSKDELIYLYARSFVGFRLESIDKFDNYESLTSKQKLLNDCGSVYKYIFRFPFTYLSLSTGAGGEFICFLIMMIIALILSIFIDFILCIIIFVCSINIESILSIKKNDEFTNELIQNIIDEHSINVSFSYYFCSYCHNIYNLFMQ